MKQLHLYPRFVGFFLLLFCLGAARLLCATDIKLDWDKELEELDQLTKDSVKIAPPKKKEFKPLEVNLPVLGRVRLSAFKKGDIQGLKVEIPGSDKKITVGNLSIDNGILLLIDGKLSYTGRLTLFGKQARFGLKQLILDPQDEKDLLLGLDPTDGTLDILSMTLGVNFQDAAVLELIPGKKIQLKDIDLNLSKKEVSFEITSEILNQEAKLKFAIDLEEKEPAITGTLKKTTIGTMLPELKSTIIGPLTFEGSFVASREKKLQIRGTLSNPDGKPIDLLGITFKKAETIIDLNQMQAIVSAETEVAGLLFTAYIGVYFGEQKGIRFTARVNPKMKTWKPFEVIQTVDLPKELKDITLTDLEGGVDAQYMAALEGKDDKAVSSKEKDKKTKKKTLKEIADFTSIEEDELKGLFETLGSTKLITAENLGYDAGFSVDFFVSGKAKIKKLTEAEVFTDEKSIKELDDLNTYCSVIVKIDKTKGKGFGFSFVFELPQGWKLSQSFPKWFEAKKGLNPAACLQPNKKTLGPCLLEAIDLLKLEHARFIISSRKSMLDYQPIERGFNLFATMTVEDKYENVILQAFKDIVTKVAPGKASFNVYGSFNPFSPKTLALKVGLSSGGFGFKLGPAMIYGGRLNCVIRGEPSIGFEGEVSLKPDPKAEDIKFAFEGMITPIKFGLVASMLNRWKDPFGIKGFEFGNLGLRVTQSYDAIIDALAAIPSGGLTALLLLIPADLGLSGDVRIGEPVPGNGFDAVVRLNLGKDITSLGLVLNIKQPLSLALLLDVIFKQFGSKVNITPILERTIPLQLEEVSLKLAPLGTAIGNIKIDQGIGGSCYIKILDLDNETIKRAYGDFNIDFSGFKFKGKFPGFAVGPLKMSGFDGTGDPEFDIQLNPDQQKFVIDGLMKLGDVISSKTKWFLTTDGAGFNTQSHIGPQGAHIGVKIKGTTIPFKDLAKLAKLEPKDITLEFEFEDLLREKVHQGLMKYLTENRDKLEADINRAIDQVGRDTAQRDIKEQEKRVQQAYDRRLPFGHIECLPRELAWRVEQANLELLKLKYGFEQTGFGKFVTDASRKLGLNKIAEGGLNLIKAIGLGALDQGKLTLAGLGKLVSIKRISWKGSLEDVIDGSLTGVVLDLCISCQERRYVLPQFKLDDPISSFVVIYGAIAGIVVEAVNATLFGDPCEKVCQYAK